MNHDDQHTLPPADVIIHRLGTLLSLIPADQFAGITATDEVPVEAMNEEYHNALGMAAEWLRVTSEMQLTWRKKQEEIRE